MSNANGFDSDEQEAYEYARWQQLEAERAAAEEEYEAYLAEQESQSGGKEE
jgi:hypothetical protein